MNGYSAYRDSLFNEIYEIFYNSFQKIFFSWLPRVPNLVVQVLFPQDHSNQAQEVSAKGLGCRFSGALGGFHRRQSAILA
jgi:hypothetical protein